MLYVRWLHTEVQSGRQNTLALCMDQMYVWAWGISYDAPCMLKARLVEQAGKSQKALYLNQAHRQSVKAYESCEVQADKNMYRQR